MWIGVFLLAAIILISWFYFFKNVVRERFASRDVSASDQRLEELKEEAGHIFGDFQNNFSLFKNNLDKVSIRQRQQEELVELKENLEGKIEQKERQQDLVSSMEKIIDSQAAEAENK